MDKHLWFCSCGLGVSDSKADNLLRVATCLGDEWLSVEHLALVEVSILGFVLEILLKVWKRQTFGEFLGEKESIKINWALVCLSHFIVFEFSFCKLFYYLFRNFFIFLRQQELAFEELPLELEDLSMLGTREL